MYTTKALILSRERIRDRQIRTVVFSRDYGKITLWEQKDQWADIGICVECVIDRSGRENRVKKMTLLSYPKTGENWSYRDTLHYMQIFKILRDILPDGLIIEDIFDDVEEMIRECSKPKQNFIAEKREIFQIIQARILKKSGYLSESFFLSDSVCRILFERLCTSSMKSILSSKKLTPPIINSLEKSILHAFYSYT